ncbi:MAG: sn-glycerol-3-phosphate ABC transporter ATP-binding protein UgpC [Deltaproteobacteria bacterium]|nr:sn-glycerol-3-phosphate ABC transporter ATP-binding protein UgpC [Deltaproteobacteria bacterium]
MAEVQLERLEKTYPSGFQAVKGIDLTIRDKEFMVLVGPSGCGKSTTLRMIAGLESVSRGELRIDGRRVNDVAPKDRDIARVFQAYALYPHMTVAENMGFALKLKKTPREEIRRKVEEAAEILEITHLLDQRPAHLSGGQMQRVAVGRAIVRQPKVFLLDEPLSNLDAKLRVQMRAELAKLHRRLRVTMIYVTHDQVEAMTMGDRITVLRGGVIQQVDTPRSLYDRPANVFVAGFIGSPPMNFLPASVEEREGAAWVSGEGFDLRLPERMREGLAQRERRQVLFGIRPEGIQRLAPDARPTPGTTVRARVEGVEPIGGEAYLHLTLGPAAFTARIEDYDDLEVGQSVELGLNLQRARLFDASSEQAVA